MFSNDGSYYWHSICSSKKKLATNITLPHYQYSANMEIKEEIIIGRSSIVRTIDIVIVAIILNVFEQNFGQGQNGALS